MNSLLTLLFKILLQFKIGGTLAQWTHYDLELIHGDDVANIGSCFEIETISKLINILLLEVQRLLEGKEK